MQKVLISVREFCEVASIGRTFANELIRTNGVTSVRLGGRRLILLSSVEALIQQSIEEQQR